MTNARKESDEECSCYWRLYYSIDYIEDGAYPLAMEITRLLRKKSKSIGVSEYAVYLDEIPPERNPEGVDATVWEVFALIKLEKAASASSLRNHLNAHEFKICDYKALSDTLCDELDIAHAAAKV
jgi:hypothetical protein